MNQSIAGTLSARNSWPFSKAETGNSLQYAEDGWAYSHFYNCRLSSAFQPVFNAHKGRVIGHVASIHSEFGGETALSPWHIFALALREKQLVKLEHLCRTIHATNFFNHAARFDKLFMTVHPRLLESTFDDRGYQFSRFLATTHGKPDQIVIEIPAAINANTKLLKNVILNYRARGFHIAANFNHHWDAKGISVYPDLLCIDVNDLLRRDVSLWLINGVHSAGGKLLARNIKTSEQMCNAVCAGADYLQGNFLGRAVRALDHNTPSQISERINAGRWQRQVFTADQQCFGR